MPKKVDQPMRNMTFRFSDEEIAWIKAKAAQEGQTCSAVVRKALAEYGKAEAKDVIIMKPLSIIGAQIEELKRLFGRG